MKLFDMRSFRHTKSLSVSGQDSRPAAEFGSRALQYHSNPRKKR